MHIVSKRQSSICFPLRELRTLIALRCYFYSNCYLSIVNANLLLLTNHLPYVSTDSQLCIIVEFFLMKYSQHSPPVNTGGSVGGGVLKQAIVKIIKIINYENLDLKQTFISIDCYYRKKRLFIKFSVDLFAGRVRYSSKEAHPKCIATGRIQ